MTLSHSPSLAYLPWQRSPESAARLARRRCAGDGSVSLTFAEFDGWVEAAAEQFAEAGVGRGSVVAVMLPNRVELLVAMVAAWRLGAAVTPVNPAFTPSEAGYQVEDAGAALLVTQSGLECASNVRRLAVDDLRRTSAGTLPMPGVEPGDLALLVYTSGSTGRPKGVMLDHANLDAMTRIMVESMRLTRDDHCLLFLPLFHVNAICVSFLAPFRVGARLSVMGRFTPDTFFDAVEKLRPTYFSAVPTIYAKLCAEQREADFSSVRFGVCGAAPASKELLEATEARFGFRLVEGYGLTECSCAATSNPVDGVIKAGTVGPALPGVRVEVMSAEGELLPRGRRGEVVVQGPIVMRGYLGRPDATAETLRDGWLHTGDVGVLDEDGYLRIVDRIKDMIIRGGENLYPKEIETVIGAHPGVMEVAVVGEPDEVFGEVPVAFVAGLPGAGLSTAALLERCREHLTRVKIPVRIHLVETLPKNPIGKIDKPTLRRELVQDRAESAGA
ncbi:long-chain fatty acid--CoA ligase [Streptomyces sp. R302]|uniref:class I adenylate-forming enzyme family protein n=1 Tax=unclassified Streptomyces TaxID=2593676 RepID=UPI00145DA0D3|nr:MULTISPECIES: AMP-binding protein [unclassified Streptomyces]NML54101.1 long-chain fatty acid--CoA ligase [Streptomyces sp. R301]NML83361.1 long-chain fatty acid--CoA ligase [Streptomyces sp. R302]